jgi:transposase-like protein
MPAPGVPVQGEIVTRGGSRRSYTPQQKVRLVAETLDAEAGSRSAVAARADGPVSGRVRKSVPG